MMPVVSPANDAATRPGGPGSRPTPFAVRAGLALFSFGAGEPALFMPYPHGVGVAGDPTPAALVAGLVALGRRVVTFDPPGAGQSPRPARLDLPEMLDCAGEALDAAGAAGPVDLLGHSQGGLAALALAIERPALVRRLVLVCTAAGGPSYLGAPGAIWRRGHPDYWRMGLPAALYWLTRRRAPATLMLNAIFRASYVDRARFAPAPVGRRDWLRPAAPRLGWNLYARRLDYRARLGAVRAPTVVLAGRHDPQMPPACAAELARGIPDARLAVFARSGHYPFVEEPADFWSAVRAFLDPPAGGGG